MAWYDTGTVSVTNGSTAVVGSGTDFISAKVQVGEAFYGPDGKIYEIAAIVSSTSLTLADNYLGTTQSGQTYKIVPTQSLVADLATNVSTLITDFANVRDLAGEGKFDDGTVAAPGITFNLDQDNGLYRIGANNWAMAVGGSKIVDLTSTGFSVTGSVGIGESNPSDTLELGGGNIQNPNSTGSEITSATFGIGQNIHLEERQVDGAFSDRTDLAIVTNSGFGLGESEKFRLTAGGNVGIGVSPAKTLDVRTSSGSDAVIRVGSSSSIGINVNVGAIEFYSADADDAGVKASIANYVTGNEGPGGAVDGNLIFSTTDSDGGGNDSPTERMRIDSSGNLLVGTTSTSAGRHFTIGNATAPAQSFQQGGTEKFLFGISGTTNGGVTGSASGDYFARTTGGKMLFSTDDGVTAHAVIDSSGHVLINNTAFSSLGTLVVKQTADSKGIAIIDDTESNTFFIENNGDETKFRGNTTSPITFSHSTGEVMRIDSSGRVGINRTPSISNSKLEVGGADDVPLINVEASGVTGGMGIGSTGLQFFHGSSAHMRIDSSGNLLVGTTDTSPWNNSAGTAADNGIFMGGGRIGCAMFGGVPLLINRTGGAGDLTYWYIDGSVVGYVYAISASAIAINGNNTANANMVFGGSSLIYPSVDNVADLGSNTNRFNNVYATNGTIQTSDRNEKQDIEELSEAEHRVAVACKGLLRKFRWKSSVEEKGDEARIHFGIIAQDLQAAFEAEGLDAGRYAMFMSNTWTDEETGEERTRLGVRYHELLAFIIAAI